MFYTHFILEACIGNTNQQQKETPTNIDVLLFGEFYIENFSNHFRISKH